MTQLYTDKFIKMSGFYLIWGLYGDSSKNRRRDTGVKYGKHLILRYHQ